jgi:hypothetical protein
MEEIAPLTEDQKKEKLQELRERLAAKRAVQSVQDKADDKRNEVGDTSESSMYGFADKFCSKSE